MCPFMLLHFLYAIAKNANPQPILDPTEKLSNLLKSADSSSDVAPQTTTLSMLSVTTTNGKEKEKENESEKPSDQEIVESPASVLTDQGPFPAFSEALLKDKKDKPTKSRLESLRALATQMIRLIDQDPELVKKNEPNATDLLDLKIIEIDDANKEKTE